MATRVIPWELTDHVCRVCFGRILGTDATSDGVLLSGGHRRYRCSNCGLEGAARKSDCICACGMRLKSGHDAGIRCERNPEPTPEFPSEIVATQAGS